MTQEIEKLKAELVAAQCRIDELEKGFDDLKKWISENREAIYAYQGYYEEDSVYADLLLEEIKRITGK